MPLYVEALFNDYNWVGAFTVAALLAMLALLTLIVKLALESRMRRRTRPSKCATYANCSVRLPRLTG
jgi:sulfate transport system permease protein